MIDLTWQLYYDTLLHIKCLMRIHGVSHFNSVVQPHALKILTNVVSSAVPLTAYEGRLVQCYLVYVADNDALRHFLSSAWRRESYRVDLFPTIV